MLRLKRQKIIFVHGGQGCGKSSVTNALREKMTHTTLMRLAGVPSSEEGALNSLRYHMSMLESVNQCYGTGMNFVFDRSFMCERVYANLGFKPHTFDKEVNILRRGIEQLSTRYDIYFVLLTANQETLQQRLNREGKPQFEDVIFDAKNSFKQQKEYLNEFDYLSERVGIFVINTDNLSVDEIASLIIENTQKEESHEETSN